ncbi:MAG: STAS domain-containing protein [Bdellovibrionales bacterium]
MGFAFEQKMDGDILLIKISGELDDEAKLPTIASGTFKSINIQMGDASYLNSSGVRSWMSWMAAVEGLRVPIRLFGVRPAFVRAWGSIRDFFPRSILIQSFFVPYFCDGCKTNFQILIKKEEGDAGTRGDGFPDLSTCPKCNKNAEIDGLVENYAMVNSNLRQS